MNGVSSLDYYILLHLHQGGRTLERYVEEFLGLIQRVTLDDAVPKDCLVMGLYDDFMIMVMRPDVAKCSMIWPRGLLLSSMTAKLGSPMFLMPLATVGMATNHCNPNCFSLAS